MDAPPTISSPGRVHLRAAWGAIGLVASAAASSTAGSASSHHPGNRCRVHRPTHGEQGADSGLHADKGGPAI